MKTSSFTLLAGAVALCPGLLLAKADLAKLRQLAPADALVYIEVPDAKRVDQRWANSPYGQMYSDKAVQAFFKALGQDSPEEYEEFQQVWSEISTHLDGPTVASLSIRGMDQVMASGGEADPDVSLFLAIGHNDKGFIIKTLMSENATKVEEPKISGYDLYKLQNDEVENEELSETYVLVGKDLAVMTMSVEDATSFAAGYAKAPATPGLASYADFQTMLSAHKDADIYGYINMRWIGQLIEQALEANRETIEAAAAEGNVVGVDQIKQVIGYNTWQSLNFSFDLNTESTSYSRIVYEKDGGLLGQWLRCFGSPIPQPDWVPSDIAYIQAMNYDFNAFLKSIETTAAKISPMAGGMTMMMKGQLKAQGIDLDAGILNNFDKEYVQLLPAASSGSANPVMLFRLKNTEAFMQTVQQLGAMQGMQILFEDYAGAHVYAMPMPPTEADSPMPTEIIQPVLAFQEPYLVYGVGRANVESVIDLLQKSPSQALFEQGQVKDALAAGGADSNAFAYVDLNAYVNLLIQYLAKIQGETIEPIQLDKHYISTGTSVITPNGMESRSTTHIVK